ncbi:Clan MG, family M24, aminopeptidase P-like metallopeptidase [Trichomonas vaginalis G3]|uniref:Clan MG, familly M24, aminopeptidase P-like metallopeptidase n=2 Tax=Trichomonas vaginalis TaxID=5722 RepID=A2F8Y2_TRIV3|nr:clan MG aminopeptidase P-like metallopeptidase [Trichomonas vaginalis G3]AEA95846.1 clan MG aminopeptidase P-like metallopeptidase [Trichomonas vaginalis]EAX98664.1 Clan MG, family M24, aminopeptidase P-like metallopeptidase [Trichomonas vaginalis G3]KAI5508422.1 clan MG aminopeptidase P-like metallopeptidase [Trichomonas vaginalis G3]|eukprot:XP_001311594.1 Clan MG, familly M24, aminopeptidase P-like metallopeptidase [Trichomonas vaginalis G3]
MSGDEFRLHRKNLIEVFKQNSIDHGIIVFKGAELRLEPFAGSDYHFYQEGMFYWMSGWEKPDAAISIDIATGQSTLYIEKYGDRYEIWTGPIPTPESIKEVTGVDNVKFIDDLKHDIQGKDVYGALDQIKMHDQTALPSAAGIARRAKTPYEIEQIKKAAELTSEAIIHVMKNIKPGWSEQQVDAEFTYYGFKNGAREKSFLTIAASGQDAVYLHNSANEGVCKDGDLLLLDCGFFWNHYAGDITRTFPVNGKFSVIQRNVYSILLEKQIELCNMIKPGLTFAEMNKTMFKYMYQCLEAIGLIKKEMTVDEKNQNEIARVFTPHSLTHHVGCNVHDVNYEKSDLIKDTNDEARTCRPGNIVTIEPGLYFHKTRIQKIMAEKSAPYYEFVDWDWALKLADEVGGIRIEDDMLVTETGNQRLSPCPKSCDEIEQIMASRVL